MEDDCQGLIVWSIGSFWHMNDGEKSYVVLVV